MVNLQFRVMTKSCFQIMGSSVFTILRMVSDVGSGSTKIDGAGHKRFETISTETTDLGRMNRTKSSGIF